MLTWAHYDDLKSQRRLGIYHTIGDRNPERKEGNEFFEAEIDYAKAKEYFEAFGEFDYRFVFQQRYYDLAMFLLAESEKNDKANASGTPEHREKQVWINLQFRVLWLKIRADTAYEGQTIGMSAKPMLYLKAFGFEIDIAKVLSDTFLSLFLNASSPSIVGEREREPNPTR